jgi:DNA-binding transcriptional LysR family regulator
MHIRTLDLNLLPVLHSLFRHRNVSKAAEELGLSQPAVSHALSRLRGRYKDTLFRRVGGRMEPTPKALEIVPIIAEALESISATVEDRFDPLRLNRVFRLGLVSYSGFYILPGLIEKLRYEAPHVQIVPEQLDEDQAYRALGDSSIDVLIGIFWSKTGAFRRIPLFTSDFNVIMRNDHPIKSRKITAKQLSSYSHIRIPILDNLDRILEANGVRRTFAMVSPNPMTAPFLVARSDMLAILPRRLAFLFTTICRLRAAGLAFEMPACEVELLVHTRNKSDAAVTWFIECLKSLAADIPESIPSDVDA